MTPASKRPATESRQEAVARLATKLKRHHSPRLTMLLVVGCAAGVGFLSSALMLWMRIRYMPVRYAIAGIIGYGVFVALMNRWIGHHARQSAVNNLMDTADVIDALDIPGGLIRGTSRAAGRAADGLFSGGRSGGGGASASFGSASVAPPIAPVPLMNSTAGKGGSKGFSFDLDLDEGAKVLPLLAVVAIIAGLVACASVIWSAPNMLAELMVDGAVAGAAYNRLRASTGDWTLGVVRRTWLPAIAIIATFVMLGVAGHHFKPEADSIGDFFR